MRVHGVRVFPQTLEERPEGSTIDAVADETLIQRLRDAGYGVEQHEDVDEAARESLREVGQGNRYRDRRQ